jgi:putative transposase
MSKRIAASQATRERLQAVMDGKIGTADGRSELIRLAARLIIEEALEAEASEVLGRERYERAEGRAAGYRNGLRTGRLATAEGALEYSAPQLRDTPEPFASAIRRHLKGRTEALEDLAVELYARGLSTRDIEKTFSDREGKPLIGRAQVSEITERLWADYEAFAKRDLAEFDIVYLFVEGIAERLRAGSAREAVIAAWGSARAAARSCLVSWRDRKKTPGRCGPSSMTSRGVGWVSPCWWSRTARLAFSGRSRNASRVRHVSAALPIA